jgi:hypothetical protein
VRRKADGQGEGGSVGGTSMASVTGKGRRWGAVILEGKEGEEVRRLPGAEGG